MPGGQAVPDASNPELVASTKRASPTQSPHPTPDLGLPPALALTRRLRPPEDQACTTLVSCGHTCLAPHQSTQNEPPAHCRGKLPLPTGNPGVTHARQGSWTGLKTTPCAVGALRAFPRAAEKSNTQGRPESGCGPELWRVRALRLAGYPAAGPARNKATNVTETTRENQIQTGQWRPVRNAP